MSLLTPEVLETMIPQACEDACPGAREDFTDFISNSLEMAAEMGNDASNRRLAAQLVLSRVKAFRRLNSHSGTADASEAMVTMLNSMCGMIPHFGCMRSNACSSDFIDGFLEDMDPDTLEPMRSGCNCAATCSFGAIIATAGLETLLPITDNAETLDVLCPVEASVRCFGTTSDCTDMSDGDGPVSTAEIQSAVALLDGCGDWAPRSVAVSLTMGLSVANPAAFIEDEDSEAAVASGIASAAEVTPNKVQVRLSLPSRRLQESGRRLQTGTVNVDATIQADNAAAVSGLQTSVAAIPEADMASSLNSALTDSGIVASVTVESGSMVAEAAPPPTRQTELPALPEFPTSAPEDSDDSSASQLRFIAAFFPAAVLMLSV